MTPNQILSETSNETDVVLIQLMKAKREMGNRVKKDSENPFHKSKYASLKAHLDLSEEVLDKHGLILLHTQNISNGMPILLATLHHPESKQWIKSYLPLPNPKGDSQTLGASITYMRRYSINSMFALNAEDDDGETAAGRGAYIKQEARANVKVHDINKIDPNSLSKQQMNHLKELDAKLDTNVKSQMKKAMEGQFQITDISQATVHMYDALVTRFENAIRYMEQSKIAHA